MAAKVKSISKHCGKCGAPPGRPCRGMYGQIVKPHAGRAGK